MTFGIVLYKNYYYSIKLKNISIIDKNFRLFI